jgi:hypothetical protein
VKTSEASYHCLSLILTDASARSLEWCARHHGPDSGTHMTTI